MALEHQLGLAACGAMLAVSNGERDPQLLKQAEDLKKQQLSFQEQKNPRGEALVLGSLANVHLMTADLKDSLQAALASRDLSAKAKDAEAELRQIMVAGHVHLALGEAEQAQALVKDGKALCNKARETKFAEPALCAIESLGAAASAMTGYGGSQDTAQAGALCALSHIEVSTGNYKFALPAAKTALDAFEAAGEKGGAAAAALALAQAHVQAGIVEDRSRQKMYMPMATFHASAAGNAAMLAKEYCQSTGAQEGASAAQAILDMERIQSCLHLRRQGFDYGNWNRLNP